MKCWNSHCENNFEFVCPCRSPPIYSCDSHISDHLKIKSKSGHRPEPLLFSPSLETKEALIDFLQQSVSNLYEFKRKSIHDYSMQIQKINEKVKTSLISFNKAIKQHHEIIFQINLVEAVSIRSKSKLDEILLLNSEESIEMLKDCFNIFDKSNWFLDDAGKLVNHWDKKHEEPVKSEPSNKLEEKSENKILNIDDDSDLKRFKIDLANTQDLLIENIEQQKINIQDQTSVWNKESSSINESKAVFHPTTLSLHLEEIDKLISGLTEHHSIEVLTTEKPFELSIGAKSALSLLITIADDKLYSISDGWHL